jgi:hypothetical protein
MPINFDYTPVSALGPLALAAGRAEGITKEAAIAQQQQELALRAAAQAQQAQAQERDAALRAQQLGLSAYQADQDRWSRANAQQQLMARDFALSNQDQKWRANQQQAGFQNQHALQQQLFDQQQQMREAQAADRDAYAENAFWMQASEAPDKAINAIRNQMAGMELSPEDTVDFRSRLGSLTKLQESARSIRPEQYTAVLNEWLDDFRGSGLLHRAKKPPTTQEEFLRSSFVDDRTGATWFKQPNGQWDYKDPPKAAEAVNAPPQAFLNGGKNRLTAYQAAHKILLSEAKEDAGLEGKVTPPKHEEIAERMKMMLGLEEEEQPDAPPLQVPPQALQLPMFDGGSIPGMQMPQAHQQATGIRAPALPSQPMSEVNGGVQIPDEESMIQAYEQMGIPPMPHRATQPSQAVQQPKPASQMQGGVAYPTTKAEYDSLPKGTIYFQNGKIKKKS